MAINAIIGIINLTLVFFINTAIAVPQKPDNFYSSQKLLATESPKSLPASINKHPNVIQSYTLYFLNGSNWLRTGRTADVNLGASGINLYEASEKYQPIPFMGLGFAIQWVFPRHGLWLDLGLEGGYTRVTSPEGRVRPLFYQDPNFDTLDYQYIVRSTPFLMIFRIGHQTKGRWRSYILAGSGISWNRASHYQEEANDPGSTATPMLAMFRSHTSRQLALTAGAGFSIPLTASTLLSIEYRYSDYGKIRLDPTVLQTSKNYLDLGRVRSHALLARFDIHL